MTLPTCYAPCPVSLSDKLVGEDCGYKTRIFFNPCFAKADFLTVRVRNNIVLLLRPYGRTRSIHISLCFFFLQFLHEGSIVPHSHNCSCHLHLPFLSGTAIWADYRILGRKISRLFTCLQSHFLLHFFAFHIRLNLYQTIPVHVKICASFFTTLLDNIADRDRMALIVFRLLHMVY